MLEKINKLFEEGKLELKNLTTIEQLRNWHQKYLSKKGNLTSLLKQLGKIAPKDRPALGKVINDVKKNLQCSFDLYQKTLLEKKLHKELNEEDIDVTLPGRSCRKGNLHLTTKTLRKIFQIFREMGFQVFETPEVESDEYNFQLLNIPEFHPARDMWDTFWVDEEIVLRTHTSPGQIRAMRENFPDSIRVILPGKCYRYEQITPRSEHQFFQVEGLAVGKDIRLTDLIGVMSEFAHKMYGKIERLEFVAVISHLLNLVLK